MPVYVIRTHYLRFFFTFRWYISEVKFSHPFQALTLFFNCFLKKENGKTLCGTVLSKLDACEPDSERSEFTLLQFPEGP